MKEQNINLAELEAHPAAQIFPLLTGAAKAAFVADIREAGGVRDEVILILDAEGVLRVLEGRNRIIGAVEAGVPQPGFKIFEGDDAAAWPFALSANAARRHMDESQRSMAAAKLIEASRCANLDRPYTQVSAAHIFNVSRSTLNHALKVLRHGDPEIIARIEAGEQAVSYAALQLTIDAQKIAGLAALKEADPTPESLTNEPVLNEGLHIAESLEAASSTAPKTTAPTPNAQPQNRYEKAKYKYPVTVYRFDADANPAFIAKSVWGGTDAETVAKAIRSGLGDAMADAIGQALESGAKDEPSPDDMAEALDLMGYAHKAKVAAEKLAKELTPEVLANLSPTLKDAMVERAEEGVEAWTRIAGRLGGRDREAAE